MTTKMTITEVKAKLLSLVDESDEIEITRRGVTVARLLPVKDPQALKGRFRGIVRIVDPNDDLYSTGDEWNEA